MLCPFLPCGHTYSHPCHLIILPRGSTGSWYLKAGVCPSITPSPAPQTALAHLSTCLLISCHSQGRNVCSHVYPSPEPLHGGRHVSSCICCVPVRCLTCLQACGVRAPHVDGRDTCLHLCLVPVLPCSGVDILVDMFMSQGHHMAVRACQFLHLPCPGKATGQHEDLCLCLLHPHLWYIQHACSCTCCLGVDGWCQGQVWLHSSQSGGAMWQQSHNHTCSHWCHLLVLPCGEDCSPV